MMKDLHVKLTFRLPD